MTSDIELGLLAILADQSFLTGLAIHPGITADQIPNGVPLLIAEVTSCRREARGLWKANCPLRLTSPAAGASLADLRVKATALASLFDLQGQGPSSSLAGLFNDAQSAFIYAGLAGMNVREQIDHERFVIEVEVELGVVAQGLQL